MQVPALFLQLMFLVNGASTSHVGGKTTIIPVRDSFQLHLLRKVIPVSWKLSLEGFQRYLSNNMPPQAFPLFILCGVKFAHAVLYFFH